MGYVPPWNATLPLPSAPHGFTTIHSLPKDQGVHEEEFETLQKRHVSEILARYLPGPSDLQGTFMGVPFSEMSKEDLLGIVYFMQKEKDDDEARRKQSSDLLADIAAARFRNLA